MKILFDICHPAHVHFFKNALLQFKKNNIGTVVTCRDKDCTRTLLAELGIDSIYVPEIKINAATQLISRNFNLFRIIKKEKPTLLTAVGGTFIAHVGQLLSIPRVIFYDGDNATFQNAITYPFASLIVAPQCYQKPLPKNHIR